jgi:hypothetical protein
MLPTLLGKVFLDFPDAKGTTYGIVFAVGSVGSLVLAPLMGVRASSRMQTALLIPMVLALLVTASVLVFLLHA